MALTLNLDGNPGPLEIFALLAGGSGERGRGCSVDGEEAAARCMNFIVNKREESVFGTPPTFLLVADMLNMSALRQIVQLGIEFEGEREKFTNGEGASLCHD